jgi:hypothetical protein
MSGGKAPDEPVGSLGEEAVKLFSAMSTWAQEHTGAIPGDSAGQQEQHEDRTASDSCQWCPLCQAASVVRSASPELKEQLVLSGLALTSAARTFLETMTPPASEEAAPSHDVEHIDLADEKDAHPWD